jgi:hypothetical protein
MGTALTRIEREFILKHLLEARVPIELMYRNKRSTSKIIEIGKNTLTFDLLEPLPAIEEKTPFVDVFLSFKGKRMAFKTRLLVDQASKAILAFPDSIYRDLTRMYERVSAPHDATISFVLEGHRFELNFPKANVAEPGDEQLEAAGFDPSRIADLLRTFREKAREFCSENKIIMFRERKPENLGERVIAKTGRVLLYPQSLKPADKEDVLLSPRILAHEDVITTLTEDGEELFKILGEITACVSESEKKDILQELYCPILYQEYVAGYIYLVVFKDARLRVSQKILDYVYQFARVLAYALKVNGYFKAEPIKEKVDQAELIDMSGTGLLFALPLREYESGFVIYTDIEISLSLKDRHFKAVGRVMRKFNDKGRLYVAVHYLEMKDEDRKFMFEFLYGSSEKPDLFPVDEDWSL